MEALTLTAKVHIIVNDADKQSLMNTMHAYRDACNHVSEYVFEHHDLKQFSLNKTLYYDLRNQFGLKAQMAQSVIKTVIARYKMILESEKQWIKPVFKQPQIDLVWNRDYSLTGNQFSVNTLQGRKKFGYYEKGMEKYFNHDVYKFGTAKLVYKHNKFFLHIPVTCEIDEVNLNGISNIVGIDRGINFLVATYDSKGKTGFVNGHSIKQKRSMYVETRRQLQRRHTPSARRRLKRIGQRENRWIQDVNHQVSKALVEKYPKNTLFVLEDLTDIRNCLLRETVKKPKDRYVRVSWAYYDLKQKLTYKAAKRQDMVIEVNPAYTSQCCPKCGHIEKANRNRKIHMFQCKNCGYKSNDDRIAAMNLYRKGIDYIVNQQVPDTVTGE